MDVIDAGERAAFHEFNDIASVYRHNVYRQSLSPESIARVFRHRWQRTALAGPGRLFFDTLFFQAEFAKGVEKLRHKCVSFAERARQLKQLLR